MGEPTVLTERAADGVALVTMNRPDRGNGVVPELATELAETLNLLDWKVTCQSEPSS